MTQQVIYRKANLRLKLTLYSLTECTGNVFADTCLSCDVKETVNFAIVDLALVDSMNRPSIDFAVKRTD